MTKVALEGVRKVYAERGTEHVAVHGIDLTIDDGEFLVLVGPSGCGKSTTLRMVAGLEDVTAGTIRIGDRVVNDVPARDRDIAMVFQNYALYPHMTVRDNLGFALVLRKLPSADVEGRVRKAAAMLDIEMLLDRKPRQLSGGQRQRVALGRAIVREPQVFLFDEPLSNLDAKLRTQTRRELAALRRQLGTTTIYVTHDQVEAMTLGDRIVVMHEGRVQQAGPPLEVYSRPANTFVASFLGSPPMNLIPGRIGEGEGAQFIAANGTFTMGVDHLQPPAVAPGTTVVLGIRPEALRPAGAGAGVEVTVIDIEPLGHEALVTVDAAGTAITMRAESGAVLTVGEPVRIAFQPGEAHWFDGATGERAE